MNFVLRRPLFAYTFPLYMFIHSVFPLTRLVKLLISLKKLGTNSTCNNYDALDIVGDQIRIDVRYRISVFEKMCSATQKT